VIFVQVNMNVKGLNENFVIKNSH